MKSFLSLSALFLALVVVIHFNGAYGELSKWGALLYLAGRLAYLPLYAFGVYLVRSLAWNVATALVWHWDCRARRSHSNCYRPLFNVADNGTMMFQPF